MTNPALHVDVRAIPDVPDAVAALAAIAQLDRGDLAGAWLGPGVPLGDRWRQARHAWEGRLLLHHACFDAPDATRWNLASDSEEVRRTAVAGASETLRVAAGLGAPFYSVEAGWAIAYTRDGADRPVGTHTAMARARDHLARSLDALAALADAKGIGLLVMTAPMRKDDRAALADPEAALALLARLGAAPLGLLVDAPAMVETARFRKEDPEPLTDALAPHARAVALHHGDGAGRRWLPVHEDDVEIGLASRIAGRAGGGARPVILRARAIAADRLRDQVDMAKSLMAPQPTVAETTP